MSDLPATAPNKSGPKPTFRKGPSLVLPEVLAARTPFARALVERRLEQRLTQLELAKRTKVPATSISAFEIGVQRPGPSSRRRLEEVLGDLPLFIDEDGIAPLTLQQLDQARRQLGLTDAE